jgi:hypothetical protein
LILSTQKEKKEAKKELEATMLQEELKMAKENHEKHMKILMETSKYAEMALDEELRTINEQIEATKAEKMLKLSETEEAEAKMKAVIGLGQTPIGASTAEASPELPQMVVRAQDSKPDELTTRMMAEMSGMGLTTDMAQHMAVFFFNTLNAKAVLTQPQPSSAAAGSGGTPVQGAGPVLVEVQDDDEDLTDFEMEGEEKETSIANGTGVTKRMKKREKRSLIKRKEKDCKDKSKGQ